MSYKIVKIKGFVTIVPWWSKDPDPEPDPDPYLWLMDPDPEPGDRKTNMIFILSNCVFGPSFSCCCNGYKCAFLFVETYNDVMSLEQTNRELAEELEEARDRLYQAQKDRKVETKELQDKSLALAEDLKRARTEAQKYKAGLEKTRVFF